MRIERVFAVLTAGLMPMLLTAEPKTVSLDECLTIALSDNPTVKIADMEVERLDYSKREVIGQLLPTIDFGATYSRMLAKQVMYMNMDGFGDMGGNGNDGAEENSRAGKKKDNGIKMGLDNSYSLGFQASLPLIAPQLWKSIGVSDTQILRSLESARQSRQSLVNQVKNAYYTLLLAQDSRKVIQESYDMAALTNRTYQQQREAGAASDYDVLRTSVAMKNIEPEIVQADIAIKQARLQLLILMGLDSNFELEAASQLSDYEASMYETVLSINPDYSGNSDLRLLDIDSKLLKQNLDIQKLAFVPTLALTANYNWTSMSNGSPFSNFRWNPYSTIGVTLSVPIFHGGQRINKVKQAKIQYAETQWQRENLERSISMQVDLAIDNIQLNVKQIASSSESVAEADSAHTIMEKSFGIGAASYLDLRDSELSLTRARLAYYQAIYNYLVAGSNLELLLGNAPIERYTSEK
ncbi:outer membrane protein TolC [Muribaculaceae bacterium]|nr:outer membrane protein TolC [Muribaculaceae bacterium]